VGGPGVDEQAADGGAGRAGAVDDYPGCFDVFFDEAEGADEGGEGGNGGAVLIVVEDGDIHDFFELVFDVVAFREEMSSS
jgi:GTPase involved in cell partitioning and DNA repair